MRPTGSRTFSTGWVGVGDRVFVLLGRVPELYVAVLGALKHRAVACTLFSAFGPEPIRQRMVIGDASVLVTSVGLYRRKIAPIRSGSATLDAVHCMSRCA
jgi:acetyl-CoA synthetase